MIDTYSNEWRRICEARWVLREAKNKKTYLDGIRERRGQKAADELIDDVALVRPHIDYFTKKIAIYLIAEMKDKNDKSGNTFF